MSRPCAALHTWQIPDRPEGPVRLLAPAAGKRSYRLVWREDGRQRERTTLAFDRAHQLGLEEALRLSAVAEPAGPQATFGAALDYHLDAAGRGVRWAVKYQRRLDRLVTRWMDPDLLGLPCGVFDPPHGRALVQSLLDRLDAAGYPRGTHEYEQMGALLSGTFRSGIEAGYFSVSPMRGVPYSTASAAAHTRGRFANVRPVPEQECPPSERVRDFAAACPAVTGRWWDGLPVEVMAFGGLRLEEALALTCAQVLPDPEAPGLVVDRQLYELTARENAGVAAIVLRPPKGGRSREAFLAPDTWERLRDRVHEVQAAAASPAAARDLPLFPAPGGGWEWASNWRRRIFNPTAARVDWPRHPDAGTEHRTWQWTAHSFRHHYANWCLKDLNISPTVVAGYMGHSSADVTERMYLHRERSDLRRGLTAYHSKEQK